MKNPRALLVVILSLAAVLPDQGFPVQANFFESTFFNWGAHDSTVSGDGNDLMLVLNRISGSGIQFKKQFLFGSIEMLIKLVSDDSARIVTAYYMSSAGSQHDEVDFEFLGNVSG